VFIVHSRYAYPPEANMAARLAEHKALLEQLYVGDDLKVKEIVDYMQLHHQVDLKYVFPLPILCLSDVADSTQ
jgi:hypothetical protein